MSKVRKYICSNFAKVSLRNKKLWKSYGARVGIISSVITLVSFCISVPEQWKTRCFLLFLFFLCALFLWDWFKANQIKSAVLKINGTTVNIFIGDLFQQEGLKVIGVNNYFDLVADDVVISKTTLHGQFVMNHQDEIEAIKTAIANSNTLVLDKNTGRKGEKSYDYGSCVLYEDYLLTVLTKFDLQNRGWISVGEYVQFWMTLWNNIDILCHARTVSLPIMGSGLTRFREVMLSRQELLEIILWTLKESGFHNRYADKSINIIVHERDAAEIDLYHIQNSL